MCGVFAYIGPKNSAAATVFKGLKKLEYRGYDSWGIATLSKAGICVSKAVGKISNRPAFGFSSVALGHTRWATHGGVTLENAHPHYSTDKSFVVVQNGIVENFLSLKKDLADKGYKFISQTDTEVIVRLIEEELHQDHDLTTAVRNVYKKITGRNTIVILTNSGDVLGARNGSPLVIGFNKENEIFFSSDTYSFADKVDSIIVLDNMQIASCITGEFRLIDIHSGKNLDLKPEALQMEAKNSLLGKFNHYMEKEINETPQVLLNLCKTEKEEYLKLAEAIKKARKVYTIGSGTAGVAAAQMAFYLRSISKVNAVSLIGADCTEYWGMMSSKDIVIALSQSGETADVVEVLEHAKRANVKIASLVNMPGSMMTRMSDLKFMNNAGPELCVMSTKVFSSQVAWGYLVSMAVRGLFDEGKKELAAVSEEMSKMLNDTLWNENIKRIALELCAKRDLLLFGKSDLFNISKEGMVKIIEGSYIHAHAIPAGDLKHYAITLIEPGFNVIGIVQENDMKKDLINALSQVKARGAVITGISSEANELFDNFIQLPNVGNNISLIAVIPLQLLAYYMSMYLGHDVDKPRNIAKSVTVK